MDKPGLSSALSRRAALAAALLAPAAARAQAAWPTRPITLVAPLAAGSSVDIVARLVAEQWAQRLGQPVPVENRPAANGNLALGQVARAAPDGYTITVTGQTSVAFNPVLYASIPYDPLRDFAYVGRVAGISNALVVRTASPIRDLAGLLAAARAAPGRLTYSSGGVGTTHHISSAMLAQQAGLDVVHVPYRGAPQGILAAQTGEVDFAYFNISTLLPGMPELAEEIMGVPVRRGVPRGIGGLVDVVKSPVYATGVGLVVYGARNLDRRMFRIREGENVFKKVKRRMGEWLQEVF
jgi:tripartite-type tricarboxylate transporter receptor subunit TctC